MFAYLFFSLLFSSAIAPDLGARIAAAIGHETVAAMKVAPASEANRFRANLKA